MRRTLLGIGAAEEGQQETTRFITLHREGARLTRNCLCPCPALSDASDTFEHTYHVYAESAAWWWWWTDVVRANCVPSRPQLYRTPLRTPPLCFFVRAKIINGQTKVRYPEVSVSWQWRSSHLESTLSVFFLPLLSSSDDEYCALSRVTSIDAVGYCNGNGAICNAPEKRARSYNQLLVHHCYCYCAICFTVLIILIILYIDDNEYLLKF